MKEQIIDSVGAKIGVEIVLRLIVGTAKYAHKTFLDNFEKPCERQELISHLFLGQGNFLFHPSTDWRPAQGQNHPPRGRGYPHDLQALRSFTPFLSEKALYQETLFFPANIDSASRLVCSGSPKANAFVRDYLPSLELNDNATRQQYKTYIQPQSLKYFFGEDLTAPKVQVISMMEGGKPVDKTRKVLWSWKGADDLKPWRPKDYLVGKELQQDFLLVSRLPRTTTGGDLLIFAGAHGAGTEAVKLLLQQLHIKQLRKLVDLLNGVPYFQFVVEVTKVKHTSRGTFPSNIKISEELPPVILDNLSAKNLSKHPQIEKKVWK